MTIEVPHMSSTLSEAFANYDKVLESVKNSEHWTDDHGLSRITLEEAVYTGDPKDTLATDTGIVIGWMQGYGKYIFSPSKKAKS